MDGTPIMSPNGTVQRFWGHDELSTAYSTIGAAGPTPYRGTFMADDFADKFNSPVVHVKWWGSYLNNFVSPELPGRQVPDLLRKRRAGRPEQSVQPSGHAAAEPDRPARSDLAPGSGTFTEKPISGGGPPLSETLYEYNAELHLGKEFFQKPDTVYWLKIVALVDLPPGIIIDPNQPPTFVPRWGWHNRDYTIMDPLASTAPAVVPGEHIDGFLGPVPGGTPVWHFQDDAVTGRIVVNHLSTPTGQIIADRRPGRLSADALPVAGRRPAGNRRVLEGPRVRAVHGPRTWRRRAPPRWAGLHPPVPPAPAPTGMNWEDVDNRRGQVVSAPPLDAQEVSGGLSPLHVFTQAETPAAATGRRAATTSA